MSASAERFKFAPPTAKGHGPALALAVLAHLVLLAALTLGVQWKRDAPSTSVQAELWSALPKAAAPKLVEPAPAPPMPPKPAPVVAPKVAKAPDADIALEREKQRREQEKLLAARHLEQERIDKEKSAKRKLEQDKQQKLTQLQREKDDAALAKKREQEDRLAQEKLKREEEKKRLAQENQLKAIKQAQLEKADAIELERTRNRNLERIAGLAGATGAATASGTAQKSSGPSGSYAGRVSASVKPNIVFTEDPADNPTALVEVRAAPDGTITSRKLLKTSGNKAWDEAVLKAIDKTAQLPRDVDGSVPSLLEINFRRRD